MAVDSTIKRKTASGSGYDIIHPKTNKDQVEGLATALANITIDSLDDIADVNAPSPSDGQALVWDNSTSKWIAADSTTLTSLGITATAAELNKMDGVTATTAELNKMDGVTATTTEINYIDGVTSAIQTQLNLKAPLASPDLTGTPKAPTAALGTDTTQIATTEYVQNELDNLTIAAVGGMRYGGSLNLSAGTQATPISLKTITNITDVINATDKDTAIGTYFIVSTAGWITGDTGSTGVNGYLPVGLDDGASYPYQLEASDWIVYRGYGNGPGNLIFSFDIVNNNDARFANYLLTTGKAADSNLLDGIDSGSFLRSDTSDTMTGKLTIDSSGTIGGATLANGWLKIGTTLAMDPNEIYFGTTGYVGTIGNNDLIFMQDSTERLKVTSSGISVTGSIDVGGNIDIDGVTLQNSDGSLVWDTDTVWTAGNLDPSDYLLTTGKAADSNLLDGIDSASFVRSDAADTIAGNHEFYSTDTTGVYSNAAIELRETNLVTNTQSTMAYAPSISWHWGGRAQTSMRLLSNGKLTLDGNHNGQILTTTEGKAVDSNLLDGIDSSQFLRSDTADTASGKITFATGLARSAHNTGHLEGSYNNIGDNGSQSNPIYTIGSSYNPAATTLGNMYGIGYTYSSASFINFEAGGAGWGMYVASDGDARIFLNGGNGTISTVGEYYSNGNRMATEAYVTSRGYVTSSGVTSVATGSGLTGGTITTSGTLSVDSTVIRTTGNQSMSGIKTFTGDADFPGVTKWLVSTSDSAHQRADARDDATSFSRLHWYGVSATGATSNFRHAWYDGANYINITAASNTVTFSGAITATQFNGPLSGNATTATTLQTTRSINGTNFNGSANITTANWGTARTLTIGNTGKSVNGSGNVSWSLAEIGALPTSGKAADANLLDGIDSSQFLRSDTQDAYTPKRLDIGVSSGWDAVGFGNATNLHFQGHNQFWVGAGNGTWFTGTANQKSQASGLASDASWTHDLLITTMPATSVGDRGITFAVDNTGAGTSGWRLGKWHSGVNASSSMLAVNGQIHAKGGHTDSTDYFGDDYSQYHDDGTGNWEGDSGFGWHKPSIVSAKAIQIQSGTGATNSAKPQLQFHQYGYGGPAIEYDGPNKGFNIVRGSNRLNYMNFNGIRLDNVSEIQINNSATRLLEGGGNALRMQTSTGYIDMGSMNTSWAHFETDRARFYFGKPVSINGGLKDYSTGSDYWHASNLSFSLSGTTLTITY
jgi:hypothetical protein